MNEPSSAVTQPALAFRGFLVRPLALEFDDNRHDELSNPAVDVREALAETDVVMEKIAAALTLPSPTAAGEGVVAALTLAYPITAGEGAALTLPSPTAVEGGSVAALTLGYPITAGEGAALTLPSPTAAEEGTVERG